MISLCCSNFWKRFKLLPTPWSGVFEKLKFPLSVEVFSVFYETRRFITVFTRAQRCTLSLARWIQSTSWHTNPFRIHFNIGPSAPHASKALFPFGFSDYKSIWISFHFHACYMPRQSHPWFDHPHNFILLLQLESHSVMPCLFFLGYHIIAWGIFLHWNRSPKLWISLGTTVQRARGICYRVLGRLFSSSGPKKRTLALRFH
jgi:hypothetical protein